MRWGLPYGDWGRNPAIMVDVFTAFEEERQAWLIAEQEKDRIRADQEANVNAGES